MDSQTATNIMGTMDGSLTSVLMPGMSTAVYKLATTDESNGTVKEAIIYGHGERIFIGLMWLIISILGMGGNGMVILAVCLSRRLRTPTNVFVVNLAVADFLSCFSLPWSAAGLLSENGLPDGGRSMQVPCTITAFLSYVASGASLYHMASIALNRVILIKRPTGLYQWLYTPSKITFLVIVSWFVAICVILLPPIIGIGGLGYDKQEYTCTDQDDHRLAKLYQLIQVCFFFPIPMIIIVVCYSLVFAHIRSHFNRQRKRRLSSVPSREASSGQESSNYIPSDQPEVQEGADKKAHDRLNRQQVQITKNLLMIVLVYVACITPYSIMLFSGSDRYTLYGGTIFLCNTWINPIVYVTKHPQFKVVLRMMLRCKFHKIPEPSRLVRRMSSKTNVTALNRVTKA